MTVMAPDQKDQVVVHDERMAARRQEVASSDRSQRRRRRRRVLLVLGGVFLAVVAVALVAISPLLAVRDIQVIGADGLGSATVVDLAGISEGQAVWSVDAAAVERRLRRRPELETAWVRVVWPGTVELRVQPRGAVARVQTPSGGSYLVADGGWVLESDAPENLAVLAVSVPDMADLDVGDRLPVRLRRAVAIAGRLPVPVQLRVEAAEVDDDGDLVLAARNGAAIRLGSIDDIDLKLRTVETMLSGQVDLDGLCELDVRTPRFPIVRRDPACDPPPPPPPPAAVEPAPQPPSEPGSVPLDAGAPGPAGAVPAAPPSPFGGPGSPEPEVLAPTGP